MKFPTWVKEPTACATRTFKVVLPRTESTKNSVTIVQTVPNVPTVTLRHVETGKLHTATANHPSVSDPEFEIVTEGN